MRSVRRVSLVIVFSCLVYYIFINFNQRFDIIYQNKVIDSILNYDISEYDGYIYIPRFNIRRLIKYGTDSSILDRGYVGIYELSGNLYSADLIILAGHNIPNVFSKLHDISIGDSVFLSGNFISRKFVVYDKKVIGDSDFSYFYNRSNELMLITCTDNYGYRLLVFLREVL